MRGMLEIIKSFKYVHLLQFYQSSFVNYKILPIVSKNANCTRSTPFINISLSTFHTVSSIQSIENDAKDKTPAGKSAASTEKKKKEKLTYITLIAPNKHTTVTTLEEATNLATRRDLKLIKIKDYQTQSRKDRQTYQLFTKSQYLQEENIKALDSEKRKSSKKGAKLLSLSSKINDHDINAKINNILKWLAKQNEVRVAISNDNGEASVYDKIADRVKETGRLVQKREKGSEIRFQILPLNQDSSAPQNSSTATNPEI